MVKPSHITFIGDRGWKRSPPRDGYYRGGDADVGVGPGETEVDRCVPLYYNGVHSGGWLGPDRGAGYKDDSRRSRTPSSRYAADVEQGLSLAHVGACESWDQPIACPPGQDHGIGHWPRDISHGRPPGGWTTSTYSTGFPNKNIHAMAPHASMEATLAAVQPIHSAVSGTAR